MLPGTEAEAGAGGGAVRASRRRGGGASARNTRGGPCRRPSRGRAIGRGSRSAGPSRQRRSPPACSGPIPAPCRARAPYRTSSLSRRCRKSASRRGASIRSRSDRRDRSIPGSPSHYNRTGGGPSVHPQRACDRLSYSRNAPTRSPIRPPPGSRFKPTAAIGSRMAESLIGAGGWGYFSGGLEAYAKAFRFVEVNATFYRPLADSTARRWRAQVPSDFVFSVKAHRDVSHGDHLRASAQARAAFAQSLRTARLLRAPFVI